MVFGDNSVWIQEIEQMQRSDKQIIGEETFEAAKENGNKDCPEDKGQGSFIFGKV